ncbi:hypothetical protein M758_2G198200 [Ceratodon purpureus]|nr:hypothetical protein M758_2G198200 [Ceratodon purpureus]
MLGQKLLHIVALRFLISNCLRFRFRRRLRFLHLHLHLLHILHSTLLCCGHPLRMHFRHCSLPGSYSLHQRSLRSLRQGLATCSCNLVMTLVAMVATTTTHTNSR